MTLGYLPAKVAPGADLPAWDRYEQRLLPMDEALVLVALDVSGRSFLRFEVPMPQARVGAFDTELVREFFEAVVRTLG